MPKTWLVITAGFILLLLAGGADVLVTIRSISSEKWASHSLEVRRNAGQQFRAIQDAESAQRGFLLTGDLTYLKPFDDAREELREFKKILYELTQDNPEQQARLVKLNDLIARKLAELGRTIELRKQGRVQEADNIVLTNEGRDLMTAIRAASNEFSAAEATLLNQRQGRLEKERTLLVVIVIISASVGILLAVLVAVAARNNAKLLLAQNTSLANEITQREKAEGQLRQTQKMEALGQLTGGVAHDFNNMLAIIVGNLDMLVRRLNSHDGLLRTLAENALTGAERATSLTKRLLAFSRLQPLNPKPTDINRCVSDMSELLRRTLGEKVSVETVLSGGLWLAHIDAPQLESAILNLAVNARDAMPEGGRLTIETSNTALDQTYVDQHIEVEQGQYVLIAVTDTGTGMTPEIMEKAFDPFFTTKPVGEGTGLGLSQVHGFIKQSHGHIKIYSEIGVGTTVKLYLPRDLTGVTIGKNPPAERELPRQKRVKVLVVEDEDAVRAFVTAALEEIGFDVIVAGSGAEALEMIPKHQDLVAILTDVVMPVMTGRQMVEEAYRLRPDLRVLYMTGYTRNAIVHNGVLDAGTRLVTKPFTVGQLAAEMRSLLA